MSIRFNLPSLNAPPPPPIPHNKLQVLHFLQNVFSFAKHFLFSIKLPFSTIIIFFPSTPPSINLMAVINPATPAPTITTFILYLL